MLPNALEENSTETDGNLVDNISVEHQQIDPSSADGSQLVVEKL